MTSPGLRMSNLTSASNDLERPQATSDFQRGRTASRPLSRWLQLSILALHTKFEQNRPIPKISKIAIFSRSKQGRFFVSTYFVNWIWKFMYKLIEICPKMQGGDRGTLSKLEAKLPKMQLSRGHCWGRMRVGSNLIGYYCYLIWGVSCHISRTKSVDPTRVAKCYINL